MDISIETAMARGQTALAQGDLAAAESHVRAAWAAGQDDAQVHYLLGYLARQRDDLDEASARYVDALRHNPADAQLHNNLAEIRRAQGFLPEAAALFQRARVLAPTAAPIAANLGSALLALKRPDLGLPHLEQALALEPGLLAAQSERAVCLCSLNRYADALAVYREVYHAHPAANDARYLESMALLALGDFENGWRTHETRWFASLGQGYRRMAAGPMWLGEDDLTARTLFVHAEQGHGDTIQFLRYIPLVRQLAARVMLEVQPLLRPLLAGVPNVYARGEEIPPYDMHCSFMSLPRAFRTTPTTIPAAVPYLTVPEDRVALWRERLGPSDGRRRVGVAWTGASAVWNRSIPLELLEPLFRRDDCAFHVVQTTMEPGDKQRLLGWARVRDLSADLGDFADTAAVTALMDLVISVDTVLAHLAGALAKPVWTMLPLGAEYRWMTEGATSPWYPTMRLFRQPALLAWPAVVEAVDQALSEATA